MVIIRGWINKNELHLIKRAGIEYVVKEQDGDVCLIEIFIKIEIMSALHKLDRELFDERELLKGARR